MDNTLTLHILRNPYGWDEDQIREARLAAADLIENLERSLEFEKRKKLSQGFVGYGLFNDGKLVTCSQQEIAINIGRNAIECMPLYVERDEAANVKWTAHAPHILGLRHVSRKRWHLRSLANMANVARALLSDTE